jgi:hypothetical protein
MTRTEQTLRRLSCGQWQLLRRGRWMDIHPDYAAALIAGIG